MKDHLKTTSRAFIVTILLFIYSSSLTMASLDLGETKQLIDASLLYLSNAQIKESVGIERFRGEWESTIHIEHSLPLLGFAGKKDYDSNNFTNTSIYNILAPILLDKQYSQEYAGKIIPMLNSSIINILKYKNPATKTFGFWQFLPKRDHMWTLDERRNSLDNPPLIRRSNNIWYRVRMVNHAENVPDDADDTATAYLALKYHHMLGELFPEVWSSQEIQEIPTTKIAPFFDEFKDVLREARVNLLNRRGRITPFGGAFLTWFEHDDIKHRGIGGFIYDLFPHRNQVYLPFGINDVDCVVNANVITALAVYGENLDNDGYNNSCDYLKKVITLKRYKICGMYYPNWNTFFYNATKAYSRGADCIGETLLKKMISDLIENQRDQGEWNSYRRWRGEYDKVSATAFAVAALANYLVINKNHDEIALESLRRGLHFLLSKTIWDNERANAHWPGGIFFSGGTVVRKGVVWVSDAFTTALVVDALVNYRKLLEQY
ncbi:MAG: hypothetical protein HQK52_15400 [Oligoflexia bacterium]|nr:hypothetical protein [Oligoflexia bacterium]